MNAGCGRRPMGLNASGIASRMIGIAIALLIGLSIVSGCSSEECDDCGKTFSGQAYYQSYMSNASYNPYREDGGELYEGVGAICEECARDRWGGDYRDHKAK